MRSGFHRASLSISLDFTQQEFLSGDPAVRRVYWHEKIHFFQVWSQGYMARLALLEWQHLIQFLETKETAAPQELTDQLADYFDAVPRSIGFLGFSAWNLSEAVTRFWDIFTVGFDAVIGNRVGKKDIPIYVRRIRRTRPTNLPPSILSDVEFDYLMRIEDWYAKPYVYTLNLVGTRLAALLFPLAAHFALQSKSPVKVFTDTLDRLREDVELVKRLQMVATQTEASGSNWVMPFGPWNSDAIAVWWSAIAPRAQAVCEDVARMLTGVGLTAGWDVVEETMLKGNPIYAWMLQILRPLVSMGKDEFAARFPDYPQIPYSTAFAIPGSPVGMMLLKDAIQPPLVVFTDRNWPTWESFATSGLAKTLAVPIARASEEIRQVQAKLDRTRALEDLRKRAQTKSAAETKRTVQQAGEAAT